MSQRGVEIVLGRLATDEALRGRFATGADGALEDLLAQGLELSPAEKAAILSLDPQVLESFAAALDPRLQKASLNTGGAR